jgi:hypothetical protein
MGWCSGTEIIDTAIKAADELLVEAYERLGVDPDRVKLEDLRPHLDEVLRPFVSQMAEKLHEGDWDCEDESEYFDRFPQEMLGHTDGTDAWDVWAGRLAAFTAKRVTRGQ